MAKVFTYELTILEHHVDTFGHVNHAMYLRLFEEARWDLVTKGGWGLDRVRETQIGSVILQANVKYRKELQLRECIRIETVCTGYRKMIGVLEHKLFNGRGEESSTAELKFALFDLKKRSLLQPTEEWLRIVGFLS